MIVSGLIITSDCGRIPSHPHSTPPDAPTPRPSFRDSRSARACRCAYACLEYLQPSSHDVDAAASVYGQCWRILQFFLWPENAGVRVGQRRYVVCVSWDWIIKPSTAPCTPDDEFRLLKLTWSLDGASTFTDPSNGGQADVLRIPKNRSTGNLLAHPRKSSENARIRFSFDAGSTRKDNDPAIVSPVAADHEVGLGASGLRRIRQLPPSRLPSHPSSPNASFSMPHRAPSMTLGLSTSRTWTEGGPSSPAVNLNEDLSRFPSESLHSFSFAHSSEDVLQNRHNLLKRSIDFLMDKLGCASNHPGLVNAQAKVSGDAEVQNMVDLLSKANVLGIDTGNTPGSRMLNGPLTEPAISNGGNPFDKAFIPRSQSHERARERKLSQPNDIKKENADRPRPGSSQPEPSLSSEASASDSPEPQSPPQSATISSSARLSGKRKAHKRTNTDLSMLTLQTKLVEALARPYPANNGNHADHPFSPTSVPGFEKPINSNAHTPWAVHGHPNRLAPPAQAIFTTENTAPWTILAANDLACLVIGVTKGEVRKLSILEVVRQDKREWLEARLRRTRPSERPQMRSPSNRSSRSSSASKSSLAMSNGITAQLLSKPSSREIAKQKANGEGVNGSKNSRSPSKNAGRDTHGVLLCGDVVPVQKRNGATASASLWVKEKQSGLIWVLEEISEDTATLDIDAEGRIQSSYGSLGVVFGDSSIGPGTDIHELIPHLPMTSTPDRQELNFKEIAETQYYAAQNAEGACLPIAVFAAEDHTSLRISSFPHIAGIMVLKAETLDITSSNSAFSAALFGLSDLDGSNITTLIPQFGKLLEVLAEEEEVTFTDGMVIPEHTFRKARDLLTMRDVNANPASMFLKPPGIEAKHRDGSDINVDVQMRIVRSEKADVDEHAIEEIDEDADDDSRAAGVAVAESELVFALWITYSRQLHSTYRARGSASPVASKSVTPLHLSPGQNNLSISPQTADSDDNKSDISRTSSVTRQIQEATSQPISSSPPKQPATMTKPAAPPPKSMEPPEKKKITDFTILEDMGQGAYGQVKLARYNKTSKKVVLKYVTKKRILVDTWTRDRRLGTVPLEIHVLDYLRRDGLKHPNIVEMIGFFEDDINYYIEMVPHGLPGMDLFDYIEMRSTMDEAECRNIFLQVVAALHHLHTKALVVHRDIKDENIILDGENKVKLIDFGSAAYIKNGPFDVFVGTIDYAAPEVLQGKSYRGKEQDVWALGILLYTLIYKENPFYSIDEIMDHELRIPWIMSEPSIELIKAMLDRDVDQRLTITQVMEHRWCRGEEE
ncbi:MAG: hypothetical protein LQ338_004017 [Usnochroma carphineum]|nr:MAG: hypothetical protein LQ338_004017 [Usnochroma carphineum]